MTTLTLPENVIETVRQRQGAGEPLKTLAKEIGLSWQRLWTLLHPGWSPSARRCCR